MSQPHHRIKRQVIEVQVSNRADARQVQDEVSRIYRQRLAPLIDHCCSALSGPGVLDRIDRLELDLGFVDPHNLEADLLDKVRTALPAALAAQLAAQRQHTDPQGLTPQLAAQLELLAGFLHTGALPWWADTSQPRLLEECLVQLLTDAPTALRRLLQTSLGAAAARQRLSHHYADATLTQIIALLTPALPPTLVDDLLLLAATFPAVVASGQRPWPPMRPLFWEQWLEVAGVAGEQINELAAFYAAGLRRLAGVLALPYADLGSALQVHLPAGRLRETLGALVLPPVTSTAEREETQAATTIREAASFPDGNNEGITPISTQPAADRTSPLAAAVDEWLRQLPPDQRQVVQSWLDELAPTLAALPRDPAVKHRLAVAMQRLAAGEELTDILATLGQDLAAIWATQHSAASPARAEPPRPASQAAARQRVGAVNNSELTPDQVLPTDEELYVSNAGLVILWPFLGHFFARLGLLADLRFRDPTAQQRAVGLLQHLVSGEQDFPEYLLPLNKLLCGLPLTTVFDPGESFTPAELAECQDLLTAVIAQAPILGELSPSGLQGSFLLRPGVLRSRDGAWLLQVERASYDLLLDRFPWQWSWVKLPWMDAPLRVEW